MPQAERPEFQAQPPGALRYRGMASSQWSITQNANRPSARLAVGLASRTLLGLWLLGAVQRAAA